MDEVIGTNKVSCGAIRESPCRDLTEGVKKTKEDGILHIIGNYHLQQSVELTESIKIVADNIQQGRITTNESICFAFKISCPKYITVELRDLHFDNVGVFEGESEMIVKMDNITVTNGSCDTPTIRYEVGTAVKRRSSKGERRN